MFLSTCDLSDLENSEVFKSNCLLFIEKTHGMLIDISRNDFSREFTKEIILASKRNNKGLKLKCQGNNLLEQEILSIEKTVLKSDSKKVSADNVTKTNSTDTAVKKEVLKADSAPNLKTQAESINWKQDCMDNCGAKPTKPKVIIYSPPKARVTLESASSPASGKPEEIMEIVFLR